MKCLVLFLSLMIGSAHAHREGHYDGGHAAATDHEFELALQNLWRAVEQNPRHGPAWLKIASVSLVRGDVDTARTACSHAAAALVEPIAVLACLGRVALVDRNHLSRIRSRLESLLDSPAYEGRVDDYTLWAAGVAAELAVTDNDYSTARPLFERAVSAPVPDQIKVAYADFLLSVGDPMRVLALITPQESNAAAVMRRIKALVALDREEQVEGEISMLDRSFRASIAAGDFEHAREFAWFYLELVIDAGLALESAMANVHNQREPEDLDLLKRARWAAGID